MKRIIVCLFLIIGICLLGNEIFNTSFAYQYEKDNSVLFYKSDYEELKNDIEKYLNDIDNILIPNSSFLYSDKLVDNYDFLVNFAIGYVLKNKEYYENEIKSLDNCIYMNKDGNEEITNNYIDINIIYDITDFYFGVKDFIIINDNVCLNNNYISLSNYTNEDFSLGISEVLVSSNGDYINAIINYGEFNRYKYVFYKNNNVLKLNNIEVLL